MLSPVLEVVERIRLVQVKRTSLDSEFRGLAFPGVGRTKCLILSLRSDSREAGDLVEVVEDSEEEGDLVKVAEGLVAEDSEDLEGAVRAVEVPQIPSARDANDQI